MRCSKPQGYEAGADVAKRGHSNLLDHLAGCQIEKKDEIIFPLKKNAPFRLHPMCNNI